MQKKRFFMPERFWPVLGWRSTLAIGFLGALLIVVGAALRSPLESSRQGARPSSVHEYTLKIIPTDINYGGANVWHAWTFNGTVPGPTLKVNVGEMLRVRVINRHDMVQSFHTHLDGYTFENDGSQANLIAGEGTEVPGAGGTIRPETGKPGDDLIPSIDAIPWLTDADKKAIFRDNPLKAFPKVKPLVD